MHGASSGENGPAQRSSSWTREFNMTAKQADVYVQHRSGSDVALINAMMYVGILPEDPRTRNS